MLEQVCWLERFPPDIWAYFVCLLPGEQLGRLMLTGAMLLRRLLKFPGVVTSVSLGGDYLLFHSFPSFLGEFPSLEELMIGSFNVDWSESLGIKIDSLPSGLRHLELSGSWNWDDPPLFGEVDETFKLHKHLPHLETLNLFCLNYPSYSWLTHSPQSLTTLSLYTFDSKVELPSSLIHFMADSAKMSKKSAKLPPSLESFVVGYVDSGVNLLIPLLPSSTRKLVLRFHVEYSGKPRPTKLLEQLPKSLTWLVVPDTIDFDFGEEEIVLLPPTLRKLKLDQIGLPCSVWPLLPQHLTELTFHFPATRFYVRYDSTDDPGLQETIPFESLPRSITKLKLQMIFDFCGPPSVSNQSFFPPQLAHLSIEGVQLSPAAAQHLPSSLTFLRIGNFCQLVCKQLPNGLETLIAGCTLLSPNLFKHLPKSLTRLELCPTFGSRWFDPDTGTQFDSCSVLPEYSIHEMCLSSSFDWKDVPSLPFSLTDLTLISFKQLNDSFLKYQSHPNMLRLDLSKSEHLTDLCIPLLSPNLTDLNLDCSSSISGKSFSFLPRCLLSLALRDSESIFDSDIQHLPRTLKYVSLRTAKHLTELCIPDLPKHLRVLYLSCNTHITPSAFPKLPYSLRSYQNSACADFANWHVSGGVLQEK